MDKDKLVELAAQCEAATGPDAQLETDIQLAINPNAGCRRCCGLSPSFTRSLDAAMTLVPIGHNWQVGVGNHAWAAVYKGFPPSMRVDPIATTPALALCAAALRSHAQKDIE